ncbi:MAG TPA: GWxTD domain-containing protein [Gemmatimonadales bacterium]
MALTALAAGSATAQGSGPGGLDLSAIRYFRAGAGSTAGKTMVDVFCRVPLTAVSALGSDPASGAAFRFALTIRDSSGLALNTQSWREQVPGGLLGVRGASTGEHLALQLAPGRYTMDAAVTDSATGRVTRGAVVVDAYRQSVGASDLMLGTAVRAPAGPADTVPRADEVWNGAVFVQTSGAPALTPSQTVLGYYLELYASRAESVQVTARVIDQGGAQVIAAAPVTVPVASGGGVTYAMLDLAGLPPGHYRLAVAAQGPDSQVVRSAPFSMTGFETVGSLKTVADAGTRDTFTDDTEAGLDSMYAPLIYLMTAGEQGQYSTLSVDAKRRWLRDFWTRRDPTPGTARNERLERFYRLVQEADGKFREGGLSAIPGWRTDRGRVYILYGPPDEVLDRRSNNQQGSLPYEVWKYTRDRALKYVFADLTRFGNFALVYTNDRRERSRPDWQDLLGAQAVQDVEDF